MPAGNRDSLIRSKDTGTCFGSGLDLITQTGIEVTETTDGPDGGNTVQIII